MNFRGEGRYRRFGRRVTLTGLGAVLASPSIARAQGQNGVALVIGNSKYKWEATLPNVSRDAPDIAARFQAMGLETELLQDAGGDAMRAAIERLTTASRGANFAAFYFAGHGVSWDKQTFIGPVDADLSDPKTVLGFVRVSSVGAAMAGAANRLLVFDSCRNNPADGWRQREAKSLAFQNAADQVTTDLSAANMLTLFSTASGAVALDGPAGENSPFAAALLRQLDGPSVDLQALPAQLRRDLLIATQCRQLVWDHGSFAAPYLIRGARKFSVNPSASADPSKLVELPGAYAFAPQNGLFLPRGLVAYRTMTNASDDRMIGTFKFEQIAPVGRSGASMRVPAIIVVLSAAAGDAVELVEVKKDFNNPGNGSYWRFVTASKTGNGASYLNPAETLRFEFAWRDQNSGRFSMSGVAGVSANASSTFTRLDG